MGSSKYFELRKEIELNTDLEQFENDFINNDYKDFSVNRSGNNKFRIVARISVGTVRINDFKFIPITTTLELSKRDNKNYVTLTNGIGKNSIIVIATFMAILILTSLFSNSNGIIGLTIFSIFAIAWFWYIFRAQEEILQASVIKSIKDINKQYEESNI